MLEAGYRCAIPTCRVVAPIEIEHIQEYAKVKKHEFHNMIVLCRNCHGLKGEGARSLDRKALRQIKANLGLINGRYSEIERRILEQFAQSRSTDPQVELPGTRVLYKYLIDDGLIHMTYKQGNVPTGTEHDPRGMTHHLEIYKLTDAGRRLVAELKEHLPITEST